MKDLKGNILKLTYEDSIEFGIITKVTYNYGWVDLHYCMNNANEWFCLTKYGFESLLNGKLPIKNHPFGRDVTLEVLPNTNLSKELFL